LQFHIICNKGATFKDKGNGEGLFDWPTVAGQAGQYEITFTASDGELTASQSAIVTITSEAGDSDGDDMPDKWEIQYALNPLFDDSAFDLDGDGITNMEEYLNDTDPSVMPGDINQDKQIDLTDAILALQIASGIDLDTLMNKAADVDGDGKIGLAEAVYVLQFVAE